MSSYAFAHPEHVGAATAMALAWHTGLNGVAWPCLPEGGIGTLVDALASACGGSVRVSTPVRRIAVEDGVAKGVVTDAGFVGCDAIVCATTATALLDIAPDLPPGISGVMRRVAYSRCCRVFFGVDSSPFPRDWYAVAFPRRTGALMAGLSNAAALMPDTAPRGKAIIDALVIDRQADELLELDDSRVRDLVLSEVRTYFPEMSRDPLFAHVHRWREAVGLAAGGVLTELERLRRRKLDGANGLFLAGDYIGVPTVNAALRSGLDAAAAVADHVSPGAEGS